jgi:formylmethanofuran dehydrogenase subunit E
VVIVKKKEMKFPSLEEALQTVPKIHGHVCSASYLGARMGLYAMQHLKLERKRDLAVGVEILTCAADGISAAAQCSFGGGRMTLLDHGKFSAIFGNWMTGEAIRVKLNPNVDIDHIEYGKKLSQFYLALPKITMEEAQAKKKSLKKIEDRLIEKWGRIPENELFIIEEVSIDPNILKAPLDQQYIPDPVNCSSCNDITESSKTRLKDGKRLCKSCAESFW